MVYSVKKMKRSGSLCIYTGWCVYHWVEKIHFSLLPHPIQGWPERVLSKQPALPSPSDPGLGIPDEWINVEQKPLSLLGWLPAMWHRDLCVQQPGVRFWNASPQQNRLRSILNLSTPLICPPFNLCLNVWFKGLSTMAAVLVKAVDGHLCSSDSLMSPKPQTSGCSEAGTRE